MELEQDMIQQQSTEAEARRGLEINEKEKEQARIRQEITELNQERLRIPNEYYERIQRDICLKQNQEKIDDAICFHTGVKVCPAFFNSSTDFFARAISSASIGRLLDMAEKNICGPYASDGNSRATC